MSLFKCISSIPNLASIDTSCEYGIRIILVSGRVYTFTTEYNKELELRFVSVVDIDGVGLQSTNIEDLIEYINKENV